MPHIGADGQIGVPDHAVSLGDAGEAAEREQKKYGKGGLVSDAADAAGNFQKAVYDSF